MEWQRKKGLKTEKAMKKTRTLSVMNIIKVRSSQVSFVLANYKDIRLKLIKDVLKKVTSHWDQNWVIYPLSSYEEI